MFRKSPTQHFFIINILIWLTFLLSLRLFQLGDSPQQLQSWCYLGIALLAAQGIAFALRKNILAGMGYLFGVNYLGRFASIMMAG